jgi:N-acetylglucosaminyldiphosphoundecaprenol N-acetyl-beta-D-mannosaminyltransferase
MEKINVAGLKVDAIPKRELIDILRLRISRGQKTFITTLYSEFLYAAIEDRGVLDMLNQADIAVADGIGIIWAAKYLSVPLTAKNYWLKILQAVWQAKYSLAAIVFRPQWIKSIIPHKIVGADLIWDLTKFAADHNLSVYLLGGFGDTPEIVSKKFRAQYPNILISGFSSKDPGDPTVIEDIKKASPDLLFVAYGPVRQEAWIARNLPNLPVKMAIGLGGTFDYIAGKQPNPPRFLRYSGLEWAFRLITQPSRIKRIFRATFGLAWLLIKFKVFSCLPFRPNAVNIIINREGKILIARFNPKHPAANFVGHSPKSLSNYWQFSQGGIDTGEDLITAARREAQEELGLSNLELIKISNQTNSYRWPINHKLLVAPRWRYKGQEQQIVYFKFNGTDKDIKLDNYEFLEYKWVRLEDLDKEVHSEKQPLAKIAQADLNNLA